MLKTNSKQAKENIRNYIISNVELSDYVNKYENVDMENFKEVAKCILDIFRSEKWNYENDHKYYNNCEFKAFADWCAGLPSSFDTCYYYNRSAIDDLCNLLNETETEKAKYTETQAQDLLTRLIYRELTKA